MEDTRPEVMGVRATTGVILHFVDEDTGKIMVPMIVRGEKYKKRYRDQANEETLMGTYSFPGGHVDLEKKESLNSALVREVGEELIKGDDGTPVLQGLNQNSFGYPIACGINPGRWQDKADWQAGTAWYGYRYALNAEQATAIREHVKRIEKNPNYAEGIRDRSNQEIATVKLVALDDLLASVQKGDIRIGYDYELEYAQVALKDLHEDQKKWQSNTYRRNNAEENNSRDR